MPIALSSSEKIDFFSFSLSFEDWLVTIDIIVEKSHYWLQLINPARVLDRIIPDLQNAHKSIYFFDLIIRILVSFLIFQVVSAFRKLHRK